MTKIVKKVLPCTDEEAWSYALGMAAIDGEKPSHFLLNLIEKQKRGEISDDKLTEVIIKHYTEGE